MNLSASLVLFHNDPNQYGAAIRSFLEGCNGILYIVDNSSEPLEHKLFFHPRVNYLYVGKNLGFGKAHNLAISLAAGTFNAHLFLNPDISFEPHVLPKLVNFLSVNPSVGAVMPQIKYPDGTLQPLCKLLPTPMDLIFRRFFICKKIKNKINMRYEMHGLPQDRPSCVPTLSACFLLVRGETLNKLGGFDERYFMYLEDVDLVRRIGDLAETVYQPAVSVLHSYAKGSYHDSRLLKYHIQSAVKYFNKWGWFFDSIRKKRNRKALINLMSTR